MSDDQSLTWIGKVLNKIPIHYFIFCLTLGFLLFLFYDFLYIFYLQNYKYQKFEYFLQIVAGCLLLVIQISGVQYFDITTRRTFRNIKVHSDFKGKKDILYDNIEKKFGKLKIYYILLFFVIAPFFLIDPLRGSPIFPVIDYYGLNSWTFSYQVISYIQGIIILFCMATNIWIILNICWTLYDISSQEYLNILNIDLFNSDNVGGLASIRSLILEIAVFSFISISLGILNFFTMGEITYGAEMIFLITYFLIIIFLFIKGWHTLKKLINNKRNIDVEIINNMYQEQFKKLQNIMSGDDDDKKNSEIKNRIMANMQFLAKERENIFKASKWTYDLKTNFTFISSLLLPFITYIYSSLSSWQDVLIYIFK